MIEPVNLATIAVAAIAAASAYASQRAATRASTINTNATSRVEMEKEAYDRARSYDTETIRRLDAENEELRNDNANLHAEIKGLRSRISRLESGLQQNLEELLHARLREGPTDEQPAV